MRKTIFAFMFAIMFSMALGSCGNGATVAATDEDSTAVDTMVVDSLVVDSVVADTVAFDAIEECEE